MAAVNKRYFLKVLLLLSLRLCIRSRADKYKKRFWVRKIYQERCEKGEYHLLVREMMLFDQEFFTNRFRMTPSTFEKLLTWVGPYLQKKSTVMRDPIAPSERLALTLRYLTTGDAQVTIGASYRISPTTTGRIIHKTCQVIWDVLKKQGFLELPQNKEQWKKISQDFNNYWNYPHALGAIDGKHIVIQAPPRAGSDFLIIKKLSIVLMGVCDAHYKFILVDVGDSGRQSDGSVYNNCYLGYAIENNLLNLPDSEKITSNCDIDLPYVLLGDDAFGLKTFMMKPYPGATSDISQRIFNYRLSRGRRTIENTFRILASRFRVFRRPINCHVDCVIEITKAAIALHNFLISSRSPREIHSYCPPMVLPQESGDRGMVGIRRTFSNNYSNDARIVRGFRKFFSAEERCVSWQIDSVTRTTLNQDKDKC
ncbi:Hypothetical predicted protein [Paramuricea clavata]|uniref:Uncharacterized protein n=1 Tax=Paramuricea clavata TaxID=317549 RepID=A0A6S7GT74_PARCT|nr:Hypothetical predicted protein [Paramuricea clavata]